MIIAPKLDTQHHAIPDYIFHVWDGAVEVQMLSLDFQAELRGLTELMDVLPPTKTLLIHLPFGVHNLCTYMMSSEWLNKLVRFLEQLNFTDDIRVVMHVETAWPTLQHTNWLPTLEYMHRYAGPKVTFLIENTMVSPNRHNLHVPDAAYFLTECRLPYVKGLVDLTHIVASESCTKETVFYTDAAREKVVAFHIASALDGDGWHVKSTHGRRHRSFNVLQQEMNMLASRFPIRDDTIMVTEVTETDYTHRPEQFQEILWLRRYREGDV